MTATDMQLIIPRNLPEGFIADASWFQRNGLDWQMLRKSVKGGVLERLAKGVYQKPHGKGDRAVSWEFLVSALQESFEKPVHVGGLSALEMQGIVHYLRMHGPMPVNLYSYSRLPNWINNINCNGKIIIHNAEKLFPENSQNLIKYKWPLLKCPLVISTKERALCEYLDEVNNKWKFHNADMLMDLARWLNPKKVQYTMESCKSIKVKRLFMFLADRNGLNWFDKLDFSRIDLGAGPRQITAGGKYDANYMITVPNDLDRQAGY